jgi:hypothetical protein
MGTGTGRFDASKGMVQQAESRLGSGSASETSGERDGPCARYRGFSLLALESVAAETCGGLPLPNLTTIVDM